MIRGYLLLIVCLLAVSACATRKNIDAGQKFSHAEFQIVDINVDVSGAVSSVNDVRRYMRNAATHIALAYNENIPPVAPEYVMEISVQAYKPAQAFLAYDVILRYPNDGTLYRALPVVYTNAGSSASSVQTLIKGSLPDAFKRIYGHPGLPVNVQRVLAYDDIFGNPAAERSVAPVTYTPPSQTTTSDDEPEVITCDVC